MISEDEKGKILQYEDFVSEVTKRRNPKSSKPWWESAGVISSITAVSTVALTSIAAYCTQSRLRDKDFTTEQSKAVYEAEAAALHSAHLLASESFHWAGERARLLVGDYRDRTPEQRKPLIDSVNASDLRWRQGRQAQKVGVELGFGNGPEVISAWDSAVARLDRYANCTAANPPRDCAALRAPAVAAINSFRSLAVVHIRAHLPRTNAR